MKKIFLEVQKRLASTNKFKHIDRNWNQLQYDQPPVSYPCALIDITNVTYSQDGGLTQTADGVVEITVANVNMVNTSNGHQTKERGYSIYDLTEAVYQSLHGYACGGADRMIRIGETRLSMSKGLEAYTIQFHVSWMVASPEEQSTTSVSDIAIDVLPNADV